MSLSVVNSKLNKMQTNFNVKFMRGDRLTKTVHIEAAYVGPKPFRFLPSSIKKRIIDRKHKAFLNFVQAMLSRSPSARKYRNVKLQFVAR